MTPEVAAQLRKTTVPTISAVLFKKGLKTRFLYGLKPLNPSRSNFVGPAFTMRAIPAREDLVAEIAAARRSNLHRIALQAAATGDVIVVGTGSALGVSLLGDIIATSLARRGVAGFVTDNDVSDAAAVATMDLPVMCVGSAPVPSSARVTVCDYQLPIGCAGVAVYPGDIMVGDANGVVCIPQELAAEVATATVETERLEAFILERIKAGAPLDGTYPPNEDTLARYRAWCADPDRKGD